MSNNIVSDLYSTRNNFIIIGLSGALGSGCTQCAEILSENILNFPKISEEEDKTKTDYRREIIIDKFYNENKWVPFTHIRVSDIIFLMLIHRIFWGETIFTLEKVNEIFLNIFLDIINSDENDEKDIDKIDIFILKNSKIIENFNNDFNELMKIGKWFTAKYLHSNSEYKIYNSSDEITKKLDSIKLFIQNYIKKSSIYTKCFQHVGDSIRLSGSLYSKAAIGLVEDNLANIFIIPEITRRLIRSLREEMSNTLMSSHKPYFVIDALRNPYEIEFFRNRYGNFYLFSILADDVERRKRLISNFKMTDKEVELISDQEKLEGEIHFQNIQGCIGKGDVFIDNNHNYSIQAEKPKLVYQLMKYVALIRNPGLITPTDDERFMQVAITARYNSGCISRQVGAVVVGSDNYIRGFGWNDTPEDFIPCLYRTPNQLLSRTRDDAFSKYERSDIFIDKMSSVDDIDKNSPFCFKDYQQEIENERNIQKNSKKIINILGKDISNDAIKRIISTMKFKNPTRERALHAEENAFLQVAKSGGQSVIGGTLYTTASPCQLCAKKAMQLKIERIVFIDPYPDISNDQVLKGRTKIPKLDFFKGAIGSAYFKLYIHMIGVKDEIKLKRQS